MLDLEQIRLLAQLVDNTNIIITELEKSYAENNASQFENTKKEIIETHKKISTLLK